MCRSDLKGCRVLITLGIASIKTLAVNKLAEVFCSIIVGVFLVIVSLFSSVGCTKNVLAKLRFLQTNLRKKIKAC